MREVYALGTITSTSRLGIGETREEFAGYLDRLSQGLALPAMRDMFIDRGNEALRFLNERIGIPFMIVRGLPDYFYPRVCAVSTEVGVRCAVRGISNMP